MAKLPSPRFETAGPIHVAGIRAHYSCGGDARIGAQWQKLGEMMPKLPPQIRPVAYGVCFDRPGDLEYVAGIEVAPDAEVGASVSKLSLPAHRYAVFPHDGHVSALAQTCAAIFRDWAPGSGCELVREKDGTQMFFERYGQSFDPQAGRGDIEVWVPIK